MRELIVGGRAALPVRLIPYITSWDFAPDEIARILANRDGFRHIAVASFHLETNGSYHPMLKKEWDGYMDLLEVLTRQLKADETVEYGNLALWRTQSIETLPASAFVWKDEFESAWNEALSPQSTILLKEREGDRELNYHPLIPTDQKKAVFDGFQLKLIDSLVPNEPLQKQTQNSSTKNLFIRERNFWRITYQGSSVILKNIKGIRCLYLLLQHPGQHLNVIHIDQLASSADGSEAPGFDPKIIDDLINTSTIESQDEGDAEAMMSPKYMNSVKAELNRNKDAIENAEEYIDTEELEKLKSEREEILEYFNKSKNNRGRSRKMNSSLEKARANVSLQIKSAIGKEIRPALPKLADHLHQFIECGTKCIYTPPPEIQWEFTDLPTKPI